MTSSDLFSGSRALRQLLPPLHQLPQGQDAHRPRHRRTGRGLGPEDGGTPGRLEQQRQQEQRRLHFSHRRSFDAGSRKFDTFSTKIWPLMEIT